MERKIYEAAVEGSVISLRNLLQEDPLVLDRIMVGCYAETPLHVASMLGHAEFVQEILSRKPELVGELDSRKSSPLHLASAKGYLGIVKKLVSVNPEICFVRDRDGRNPLHIAAIKGHINVLRELVQVKPQAARISMDRGETILHACVKYNQFEAMKFLVEKLSDDEFVNCKDDDGNTILHLAVDDKQVEAIKFLTTSTAVEVNALNANGLTAMDILMRSTRDVKDWEIGELLRQAGGISAGDGIHSSPHDHSTTQNRSRISTSHGDDQITKLHPKGKGSKTFHETEDDWLEKKRNVLLVVAALFAIIAFQAGLNPPGGLWQDDSQGNFTLNIPPHKAGQPIWQDFEEGNYKKFVGYNTTALLASLSIILLILITSGMRCLRGRIFMRVLMVLMWGVITLMFVTYLTALFYFTTENSAIPLIYILLVWIVLMAVFLLLLVFPLLVNIVRKLLGRQRQGAREDGREPHATV